MYPVGSQVFVTTIGRVGRVVSAGRGGRYRVQAGGVEVACREADLAPAPAERRGPGGKRRAGTPGLASPAAPSAAERARLGSIDLHGATVEEALRAVEARVNEAILAGLDHLDVIHGIGTGRIRHALHRWLAGVPAVRHFELAPGNPGVTRVYF